MKIRDQVALAENHNKRIFPVFIDRNVPLDSAMEYTLASMPKFYMYYYFSTELIGYQGRSSVLL